MDLAFNLRLFHSCIGSSGPASSFLGFLRPVVVQVARNIGVGDVITLWTEEYLPEYRLCISVVAYAGRHPSGGVLYVGPQSLSHSDARLGHLRG